MGMGSDGLKSEQRPPVICLMGPTASGKTALACRWYEQGRYRLISVDSALVYRRMDIGTAKPSPAEQAQYPHALIDVREPHQSYSVADFLQDAHAQIAAAHVEGATPILVGGTLMYFNALLHGLAPGLPSADAPTRAQIEALADAQGWEAVHAELQRVDAITAARFLPSDRQRVLRALEVYRLTGKPLSAWHAEQAQASDPLASAPYAYRLVALLPQRPVLHERIALRLQQMWAQGLMEEVAALRTDPRLHAELPSMRAVGYRQVWQYLAGEPGAAADQVELQDRVLFATRQLAKRQYTWLRSLQRQLPLLTIESPEHVDCP